MKMKKFCAVLLSCVMAVCTLTFMPASGTASDTASNSKKNVIQKTLEDLSLKTEPLTVSAATTSTLRRPVSPEQPMWIVHIDSWNYADPQKIIDLIPDDILPYVVFNISLSINWDSKSNKWLMVQDGYETAKSWLRTCAENQVWAMIQPSSGGQSHFPDYDSSTDYENTIYAEFYRDYPNFIGFNYCEQFWGFESEDFPITPVQRYKHFAQLLKLSNKYGGYLVVSWCGNQWSPNINPIAMLKRVPEFEQACRNYTENYILEEKYTQGSYISDMESLVLGSYLSGYCGNFGIRYDETGWTDAGGAATKNSYILATGLPVQFERLALNGMTVIDGPELVWADDFKELWASTGSDGYTTRKWAMYDQFQNDMIDMFRKVLDGTVRIPTRQEVINRTKVAIIQDVNSGTIDDKYSTPETLFEGLYRMSGDGNLRSNLTLYKSTGRYPTIPTVYALSDDLAKTFQVQIKKSSLASRWPTITSKVNEMNGLFASEYYGNCYAARNNNTWVTYNPFKTDTAAGGFLSLKYNTCKQLEVTYSQYTTGIINEYADHLDIYLNNYDNKINTGLRTDTIKIYGAKTQPSYTYKDRGVNQKASELSASWSNGVYTLTIKHNGPVDLTVNCAGSETNRLTSYNVASLKTVPGPSVYTGPRQYEAEFYDYKNIEGNVTNGCNSGITGYQGQGFMKFGAKSTAAVRDTVTTLQSGTYKLNLRYAVTSSNNKLDLYVNGSKAATLSLNQTSSLSNWATCTQQITLNKGQNTIELKAASTLGSSLYLDNFVIESTTAVVVTPSPSTPAQTTAKIADGWYYLKNVNSQKYLQVADNIGNAGQNVEIGTGTGAAGQKWYLTNTSDGYVTLTSALGNYMLDVSNASNTDGANIQIYHGYSGNAQKFIVNTTSTNDVYTIGTKISDDTKMIDVYNFGTTDGTNVIQWTYGGRGNQQWIFEKTSISASSSPSPSPSTSTTPSASPSTGLPSGVTCTYSVVSDWGNSFQAEIVLKNDSNNTYNGWTLNFDYNSTITNLWGAELSSQSGTKVVIKNPSWDAALAPDGSVTINFIATLGSDKNAPVNYSFS